MPLTLETDETGFKKTYHNQKSKNLTQIWRQRRRRHYRRYFDVVKWRYEIIDLISIFLWLDKLILEFQKSK